MPRDRPGRGQSDREVERDLLIVQGRLEVRVEVLTEELREKGRVNERGGSERRPRPDEVVERLGCMEARAEAEYRVSLVGHERCGEDKAEHVGSAVGRVGDHNPPVRVSNENLRARDAVEHCTDDRHVLSDRQQAKGRGRGREPVLWSPATTMSQPGAEAQAPWTRTIVGLSELSARAIAGRIETITTAETTIMNRSGRGLTERRTALGACRANEASIQKPSRGPNESRL